MVKAELKLPKKVDSKIGTAFVNLSEGVSSLMKLPEKTLYMLKNTTNTLFCLPSAWLQGKAEIIKAKSNVEAQKIREEKSTTMLLIKVLEIFAEKEKNGEEIPNKIEDSDNLFAIQNAASEYTDEDFIKFWARLYTEEACKPNTVSKKTINLCKDLDKKIINILETNIFPYCDTYGFYLADRDKYIEDLIIARDYGFLKTPTHQINPHFINEFITTNIGQYSIYIFPGYNYKMNIIGDVLSISAIEINNILHLDHRIRLNDVLAQLINISANWNIYEPVEKLMIYKQHFNTKFFITENNNIIYPNEWIGKSVSDIKRYILSNIEYKYGAEQYFVK